MCTGKKLFVHTYAHSVKHRDCKLHLRSAQPTVTKQLRQLSPWLLGSTRAGASTGWHGEPDLICRRASAKARG